MCRALPAMTASLSTVAIWHTKQIVTNPSPFLHGMNAQISAVRTVPGGPSIACSTPRAIEWDESFKGRADCSGRAVAGVHADAYDATFGQK